MSSLTESFIVSSAMIDTRLDKLLVQTFPYHSRTYFQYLIASGLVLVNGEIVKKRETFQEGDEIEICFEISPELSIREEDIPLEILYEDSHLIVINKPAGMVTHPAPGHSSGTFANALLFHCKHLAQVNHWSLCPSLNETQIAQQDASRLDHFNIANKNLEIRQNESIQALRPGIVHRLDKDTSGVLVAAKTVEAHQRLVSLFAAREVTKHYLALSIGNPGLKTIEAPIKRHPVKRQQMHIDSAGKSATTICRPLLTKAGLTWVDVQPITGRTHQIRVHLQSIGTPILGDPIYGSLQWNEKYGVQRQMLHARSLAFIHPISGSHLHFEAPIPSDMQQFDPPNA